MLVTDQASEHKGQIVAVVVAAVAELQHPEQVAGTQVGAVVVPEEITPVEPCEVPAVEVSTVQASEVPAIKVPSLSPLWPLWTLRPVNTLPLAVAPAPLRVGVGGTHKTAHQHGHDQS